MVVPQETGNLFNNQSMSRGNVMSRSLSSRTATFFALLFILASSLIPPSSNGQLRNSIDTKEPIAPTETAPSKHLLWRMTGDSNVVYIMGSIHLLPKDFYPLDPLLERAFDSSDALVLEMALDSTSLPAIQQKLRTTGRYNDGRTLANVLSAETYAMLEKRFQEMGIPAARFQTLKPWAARLLLSQIAMKSQGNDDIVPGVDIHFSQRAGQTGKKIMGLETVETQIDIFDKMPLEKQEADLRKELEDRDSSESSLKELADAWRRADLNEMQALDEKLKESDPALYRKIAVDRNNAWLPQIEQFAKEGKRYLVVVGTLHLAGEDGVIEQLRRKGYRLEQL
jgi:uncharacterized protein YbaP (TraB family)